METINTNKENTETMQLGEAIERILIESGMSISAFSRKVGYSRQYIYELLRTKEVGFARKIQLDTLKRICDTTGYSLVALLADIGYIPQPKTEVPPYTVIVVKRGGERVAYTLGERNTALIEELAKSLLRDR